MARTLNSILRAQGRLKKLTPVAIIDIGSNSVRLVIYEGLSRSPTVLFNEKILCGLGAGLAQSGQLNPEGVDRALAALRRFRALTEQAQCDSVHPLATAAARDASNGPAFIEEAERILGVGIGVLTGKKEAKFAALGIVCGFADPDGIAGDMGGGSLEFAAVHDDDVDPIRTTPLGGLRLADDAGGDLEKARAIARKYISNDRHLKKASGKPFYAVGGTWRAFGRLHMERHDYPLSVMHEYAIDTTDALALCERIIEAGVEEEDDEVRGIDAISSNRQKLLPFGAVVLREIIERMAPSQIVFSALGLREGYLYSLLPKDVRKSDPLLAAAEEFAVLRARSPIHARELARWTGEAFEALGYDETPDERRYRRAACLMADISWRSHPDYRGGQALNIISHGAFVGVGHEGRAFIALANYYRHEGVQDDEASPRLVELAGERARERARLLGALMRVAYLFSAAMPGIIPQLRIEQRDDGFAVTLPERFASFDGEAPAKRIKQLSKVIERDVAFALREPEKVRQAG